MPPPNRTPRPPAPASPLLLFIRSEIRGRDAHLFPEDPTQPRVVVPNRGQGAGFGNYRWSPRNWLNHTYLVETRGPPDLAGPAALAAVGEALRNRPTPGNARPATPEGTLNDVGPIVSGNGGVVDEFSTWLSPNNYVYSFALPSPRAGISAMVVNYTRAGQHTLDEGFVLRYARLNADGSITLVSYGEGNAAKQSWATNEILDWRGGARRIWSANHNLIFAAARGAIGSRT